MKIFHVLNHFLPQQTAGTEVYTWALCRELLEGAGVEISERTEMDLTVVIPNEGKSETATYTYNGIPVVQYPEPSVVDKELIQGKRKPDGLKYFKDLLLEKQPDIVHFHELNGSNGITIFHVQAAKESGAKVLMTFHLAGYSCRTGTLVYKGSEMCDGKINLLKCSRCYLHSRGYGTVSKILTPASYLLHCAGIDTTKQGSRLGTALGTVSIISGLQKNLHQLIDLCDGAIVLTKWYRRVLELNGVSSKKIYYVPQGLPLEPEQTTNLQSHNTGLPLRLLFLGRIDALKGLDILLEAIRNIPGEQIELDIYGQVTDNVYHEKCRELSAGKKNIRWMGRVEQQHVVATMRLYDALCLCSTFSEMSPLVIQEAFKAGIPVIASNVYGNSEQIEHQKNGLLFEYKNSKSLQQQLMDCIASPELLAQLKRGVRSPGSFKEVACAYREIYSEVLGKHRN